MPRGYVPGPDRLEKEKEARAAGCVLILGLVMVLAAAFAAGALTWRVWPPGHRDTPPPCQCECRCPK